MAPLSVRRAWVNCVLVVEAPANGKALDNLEAHGDLIDVDVFFWSWFFLGQSRYRDQGIKSYVALYQCFVRWD